MRLPHSNRQQKRINNTISLKRPFCLSSSLFIYSRQYEKELIDTLVEHLLINANASEFFLCADTANLINVKDHCGIICIPNLKLFTCRVVFKSFRVL